MRRLSRGLAAVLIVLLTWPWSVAAARNGDIDLTELSLKDLLEVEIAVTSVSRRKQSVSKTASAVHVITAEEIRRSGATSLPDALRLAPGVHVARLNATQWAVGVRGFTYQFNDKLLVMIDGRTVYNSVAGMNWEHHDVPLETIDRIEVVRGPGSAMWGANAFSGVVNVITKQASDTHGALVEAGAGGLEGGFASAWVGGEVAEKVHYRVEAKTYDRGEGFGGPSEISDGHGYRLGGRLDWQKSPRESLMFSAGAFTGGAVESTPLPSEQFPYMATAARPSYFGGGHAQGRWSRSFTKNTVTTLQSYYERVIRDDPFLERRETQTLDFDLQTSWALTDDNELLWGVGQRTDRDDFTNGPAFFLYPASQTRQISNAFVQDEISLFGDRLTISGAVKMERNDVSGWETQPKASALWEATSSQSVWFNFARAVRIPSRVNRGVRADVVAFPGPNGERILQSLTGDTAAVPERLDAFEAGHRLQLSRKAEVDTALFYNRLGSLILIKNAPPVLERETIVYPLVVSNLAKGAGYGGEVAVNWRAVKPWKLTGSYSWLGVRLQPTDPATNIEHLRLSETVSPRNQVQIRSYLDLPGRMQLDGSYAFTEQSPGHDVPSFHRVDFRWSWRATERWELEFIGQNLLNDRHRENSFLSFGIDREFGRSAFVRTRWSF